MKIISLVSGGKDSILAMLAAYQHGYDAAVIVNISPSCSRRSDGKPSACAEEDQNNGDIDSYMFQTVGNEVVEEIAHCLQVPLRRAVIFAGQSIDQTLEYTGERSDDDEVEALYRLLKEVHAEFPEATHVTSGAILSRYQLHRVEAVCNRLGLTSLAYLWQCTAAEVLDMASALSVRALLVKTASIGLHPRKHLGKTLEEMRPTLERLESLYGSNMAGEGGEFETIVLDCPLYREEKLQVTLTRTVMVDDNDYSPSGHSIVSVCRVAKDAEEKARDATILARLRAGDLRFPSHKTT